MSSFDDVPLVEVFDVFGEDEFVGPLINESSAKPVSQPPSETRAAPPSSSSPSNTRQKIRNISILNRPNSAARKTALASGQNGPVLQSSSSNNNSQLQSPSLTLDSNSLLQSTSLNTDSGVPSVNWTPSVPVTSGPSAQPTRATRSRKSQIETKTQPKYNKGITDNNSTTSTNIGQSFINNPPVLQRQPLLQPTSFAPPYPRIPASQHIMMAPNIRQYNNRMSVPPNLMDNGNLQILNQALAALSANGGWTNSPLSMLENADFMQQCSIPFNFMNYAASIREASQYNESLLRPPLIPQHPTPAAKYIPKPTEDQLFEEDEQIEAEPEDDFREVEMYAEYVPSKLKIGRPHPDPVVETSSLSTVEPPDVSYELQLPRKIIDKGLLSALQLEAVVYACQQHSAPQINKAPRRGFLIGDGAGVGKGRTIAGIIYENYLRGRKKSIWVSVSTDLRLDAERDLRDIGAQIPVHLLGKFTYGKKLNVDSGVIFSTYSGLVSKSQSVKGSLGSRLGQLLSWVGSNFDGVIVFDECHKAKNINPNKIGQQSKTATAVLELQEKLPEARVVYASATGACETKNLGYMTRLGMWGEGTPYPTFSLFRNAIEKRGVGAMELVAVDLKMRGSYIARQLSFKNTTFRIQPASLTEINTQIYDACCKMWADALKNFQFAAEIFAHDKKIKRSIWPSFWAAHQKFFHYLCIGVKVPVVINLAKEAIADGKCVVIGLQSTGESKTNEALEEFGEINDFISTARAVFESLVENHFPVPHSKPKRGFIDDASEESVATTTASSSVDKSSESDDVGDSKSYKSKTTTRRSLTLKKLSTPKKEKESQGSSRSLRAKKRSILKQDKRKSRIKKISDDSDTELSNPLTSCSSSTRSSETITNDTYSEDEYSSSSSNDGSEISEVATKKRRPASSSGTSRKGNIIESDDECEITATVSRPKNYEVITLSSGDEGEGKITIEDEQNANSSDPMKKHGSSLTAMRDRMLQTIKELGPSLPNNTLDELINQLGGGDAVAEMTGRKGRIVQDEEGYISYKNRFGADASDIINIAEKERFMKGEKLIAIISEAASSGISLQADRRVANKKRRVHITIELPWSADRAIQQFGRTHRSNQVSAPEYIFIISELAGERRFASIVAKRLESLGALTHGDRRSTTQTRDMSQFNIMGRYSHDALMETLRSIAEGEFHRSTKIDYDSPESFITDARQALIETGLARGSTRAIELEYSSNSLNIPVFLNRILGMRVKIQNSLFQFFTDTLNRIIRRKKFAGMYDSGIIELNNESGITECAEPAHYHLKTKTGPIKCSLWSIKIERGVAWDKAEKIFEKSHADQDQRNGFYKNYNPTTKITTVSLYVRDRNEGALPDQFRIYRPNTGLDSNPIIFDKKRPNVIKTTPEEATPIWTKIYVGTEKQCMHMCLYNSCSRVKAGMKCDVGLRYRNYTILSGGILTAWPYLEKVNYNANSKLQIVRLKLSEMNRVIGPIIPQDAVASVKAFLNKGQTEGVY